MEELVYKSNLNQDWISLIFFFNLILVTLLFRVDPIRFSSSIRFYSIDIYVSKYFSEKNINLISIYNIICFVIIINTVCLFIISISKYTSEFIFYAFEYYYLFFILFLLLSIRFFLIQFLIKKLKISSDIKISFLKSFMHNFRFALFYLIFLFVSFYVSIPKIVFTFFSICLFVALFFYQFRILVSLFQSNPMDVLYIIIYLCTFKAIPWYWFYIFTLEPWLLN